MSRPAFLEEGARSARETARVAVLPVPWEATVSWGAGAGAGPSAILAASVQLELRNERTGAEPFRAGVWTDEPLDLAGADGAEATRRIERRVGALLDEGKWVVMLGGEHSVTPGAVRAAATRHDGLQLVQLDAHTDLRESYEGNRWSHACAMARCLDQAPIRAIGIRSSSAEEARRIAAGIPGYRLLHARELGAGDWIERALEGLDGKPVYLTVDVDYFDPAVMPATGTPEPGGGQWWPTLELLERLFSRARVVAADVVELAPAAGLHHADFTAARLVYEMIGLACPAPPATPA